MKRCYYKIRAHFGIVKATNVPFVFFWTETVKCDARSLLQHFSLMCVVAQCLYINVNNYLYKKTS